MPPMAQKLTACTAMVMTALAGLLEGWMATLAPLEPIVAHCLKDATTCDIIEESPGEAEENYDIRTTSQKLHGQSPGAGLSQAGAIDLALRGWTARKILKYYYPGTTYESFK